ncbi:glycosyltransferase [Thalassobacter stenotrophicus]|uniref:MraY family glycosyltransferase n=1 Tax=Thalassobacter stenotrophicus TaxID=266809 RepID=UPI0022A8D804|nr:glycosyltransferase [Thalassobacter stenotrophicus]UYP68519.1 glycosyltransferase [Thalassobacter stenotrophicus]
MLHFEWHEYVLAALAFAICVLIVLLRSRFPRLSGRAYNLQAVQSMHTRRTPHVGGIAIFGTLGLSVIFAPASISGPYANFVLATSLLFVVGLAEDLGIHMSPRRRMLAAMLASLLAISLLGVWLPRAGIPGLDLLVNHWAIGVPLTLLVTAGIANAFNLIDGVNGLAALTAIAAAMALSQIAELAGYTTMVHLAMMVAAGIFGFFLVNYPYGLIFLGDAGAYTIGFVLSWFGISVLLHSPDVSPWAILLTMYWPVADTSLAIYRRFRKNADVSAPDRLHVHQMVMRALEICILGRNRRHIANPLTTLVLSPFVIAPPIVGVLLWNQNQNTFLAVVVFGVLFFASYAAAPRLTRRLRR